jgi:hypothetical protein
MSNRLKMSKIRQIKKSLQYHYNRDIVLLIAALPGKVHFNQQKNQVFPLFGALLKVPYSLFLGGMNENIAKSNDQFSFDPDAGAWYRRL